MMEEAEVVLMDFRGFDPSNLGCAYEVGKVVNTVDLDKLSFSWMTAKARTCSTASLNLAAAAHA